jgi:hypothetical protein
MDWGIRRVTGRKRIKGVLHYLVHWCPTWMPLPSLQQAQGMVDEFERRVNTQSVDREGHYKPGVKRGAEAMMASDVSSGLRDKRRRGRPRKQK